MKKLPKKTNVKKTLNVLVTGSGGPAGIIAHRLLVRERGVHVFGTDMDPLASGQFFADAFATMAPVADPGAYRRSLRKLIRTWDIDVVIPTVHEELPLVHDALRGLAVSYVLSPQDTLHLGDNKQKFFEWAEQHVPECVPKWYLVSGRPTFKADEVFIKPVQGRGGRGCRKVTQREVAFMRKHSPEEAKRTLVCEYLPGTEWTVDVYMRKDNTPAYIIPRERIGLAGGISIKGRTVKHTEVIERTKKLLEHLSVRGPIFVQWKADKNGEPKLVEMNPRLSGGTLITVAAGGNPIRALLDEVRGNTTPSVDWQEVTVVGWLDYKPL